MKTKELIEILKVTKMYNWDYGAIMDCLQRGEKLDLMWEEFKKEYKDMMIVAYPEKTSYGFNQATRNKERKYFPEEEVK